MVLRGVRSTSGSSYKRYLDLHACRIISCLSRSSSHFFPIPAPINWPKMEEVQAIPSTSTNTQPPTESSESTQPQPLSKNAQKKLARAARLAEQKKERRAYEKEKKKEKKRQLAEKRAAGELGDGAEEGGPRKKAKTDVGPRVPFKARIVVDLGFDDLMSENVRFNIRSLYTLELLCVVNANGTIGNQVVDVSARVYLQREPQSYTAFRICSFHITRETDAYAT